MAKTPGRVRLAGVLLLLFGGALKALGLWLAYLSLNWKMPDFVPSDVNVLPQGAEAPLSQVLTTFPGIAAAYLVVFGGLTGLNGLWMLVLARRSLFLVYLLLLVFLIFVGLVIWLRLDENGLSRLFPA